NKLNLATVRTLQERYVEALQGYAEARAIFEALGEPLTVATSWHQIGMVHRQTKQFEQAEQAYRNSLAINVNQKELNGEADNLVELGTLYHVMGRLEEAIIFYQKAAEIYTKLSNLSREGSTRNNLAATLIELQRYDEARRELQRAIECNKNFGHAAKPWKAWGLLYELEQAVGSHEAADRARRQAIESYVAYRRAGGEPQNLGGRLAALIFQAMQQGQMSDAEQGLVGVLQQVDEPSTRVVITKLQAILYGDRNPALAEDPALEFDDAVELMLLLEALESIEQAGDQGSASGAE
ncbi:MAG: tetratricopeptide repeat protein, partial [Chloroflexi bacterium]|nr:tetratricopeptide repeat protein [Chloroflexota bacterium]